jgi:hypothetical protein
MRIDILSRAEDDLVDGHRFYERQESGIGQRYLTELHQRDRADILIALEP